MVFGFRRYSTNNATISMKKDPHFFTFTQHNNPSPSQRWASDPILNCLRQRAGKYPNFGGLFLSRPLKIR